MTATRFPIVSKIQWLLITKNRVAYTEEVTAECVGK